MPKPAQTKSKRPTGEALWASRKEEILTQAASLFAKHGYAGADTQLLIETIGIGKGTVYRYFPSKRELFLAAVDRVMRMVIERVDQSTAGLDDPLDIIRCGSRAFLGFFAERPEFVELLIQERALFKDRTKPTFIEHRIRNIERWRALYRTLIAEGRVRDIPVDRITDVVGHLLYGTIFLNYFSGQARSPDIQAHDIISILYHGLLTPEERERQNALATRTDPPSAGSCE